MARRFSGSESQARDSVSREKIGACKVSGFSPEQVNIGGR